MKSRQSNPKRLRYPNSGRIRAKSLCDAKPGQLQHKIIGDPDLRTAFRNYLQLMDAISGDPELEHTFARLISDGSTPWVLLWLLDGCVAGDQDLALWKKDLDSLKSRLDGLIRRLETLRVDVVGLGTIRISDVPMADSLSFDDINDRVGTKFARDYMFRELPGRLALAKASLKELKQNLAKEHSVRLQTFGQRLAWLYLYCCASTGRHVTYREIANLLNAGFVANDSARVVSEPVVRMSLQRFKRSAATMSYEHLESLMKDYVRSCPTGSPTLADWISSKGADWISSHIKPISLGRIRLEQIAGPLKFAERERPKK